MKKHSNKYASRFYQAVLSLHTQSECRVFFEDIFTPKELSEVSQRFEIAEYLSQGKSYSEINQLTGASTATICRIKKCLAPKNSGYRIVLGRLNNMEVQP